MKDFFKKMVAFVLVIMLFAGESGTALKALAASIPTTNQQKSQTRGSVDGSIVYESPASEVPDGALIIERFWKYTYTSTFDSENPALPGYTSTGSEWKEKESGTANWANFPSGFDQNHEIYKNFAHSQPYTDSETNTEKIVVSNTKAGYVYWHWMYSSSTYSNNMQRPIYNKKGVGPATNYNYKTMQAQISSIDHPVASSGYVENTGLTSYDVSSEFHTYATIGHTPRCFRFEYYTCRYTKYVKVYHYTKVEQLSSDTANISGDGVVTDIVEWVRYRLSEYDGTGLSDWTEASLVPEGARIEAEKWLYSESKTCESTEPSLEGWTLKSSRWEQTATGSVYYVPDGIYSGFDKTHPNYTLLNNPAFEPFETNTNKREVTNSPYGYCYWHWTEHKGTTGTTWYNRAINGEKTSTYQYFASILDTDEWVYWKTFTPGKYYRYKGYSLSSSFSSAKKPSGIGSTTNCFNFYGFQYYISSYTDYQRIFTYEQYTTKESYVEVTAGGNISNVVKYVRYVLDLEKVGDYYYDPYDVKYTLVEGEGADAPGSAIVWGLRKSVSSLTIPSVVYYNQKSYRVVRIEANAFKNQTSISEVIISNNVVFIGDSAFEGCTGIKTVSLPGTVKTVGKSAFKGCTNLISASLGNGISEVSESLFSGCTKLEKVSFGRDVVEIKGLAFNNCNNLVSLHFTGVRPLIDVTAFSGVQQNNKRGFYYGVENENDWINSVGWSKEYVNVRNNGYLLPGDESVAEWLIFGQNTIAYLDNNGFDYQGNKYSCNTSTKTASLISHSDADCVSADGAVSVPSRVYYLNAEYTVTSIGGSAFRGSENLKSVTIGSTVKTIGEGAFSDCYALKFITVEGNLTSVQDNAFSGCNSIQRIAFFGNAPTGLSDTAFPANLGAYVVCSETATGFGSSWKNMSLYHYRETEHMTDNGRDYEKDLSNINYKIVDESQKLVIVGNQVSTTGENSSSINQKTGYAGSGEITIADFIKVSDTSSVYMVVGLDRYAFNGNNTVTAINLGRFIGYNGYENAIWDYSFMNTRGLSAINVSTENKEYSSDNGVLYKTEPAGDVIVKSLLLLYPSAKQGTEFTIPDDVNIGAYAFANQANLKVVNLEFKEGGNTVGSKQIGNHAFNNCKNLTTVKMTCVEQIDACAFEGCSKLEKVTLPSVGIISDDAFSGCSSVTEISFSSKVFRIGVRAFKGCSSLTRFVTTGSTSNPRYYIDSDGALIETAGKVLIQYPAASSLKNYVVKDEIKKVADYAFSGNKNLTSIIIGNGTEIIGVNAFDGCSSLGVIAIGTGVKYKGIGKNAFNDCDALTEIVVSAENAFYFSDKGVLYSYRYLEKEDGILTPVKDEDGKTYPGTLICYPRSLINNSYTIISGTTEIGTGAFAENSHIKRIIVPDSVNTINDMAFKECDGLEEIIFKGKLPLITGSSEIFSGIPTKYDEPQGKLTIFYSQSNSNYWFPEYKLPYEFKQYFVAEYNAIEALPELPNDTTFSQFYGIVVVDSLGRKITNASVKFGDYYMSSQNGIYVTSLSEAEFNNLINTGTGKAVKVTCNGYAEYNDVLYLDSEMRLTYITLKKDAKVWGVSFNGSELSNSLKDDINSKTVSVNKWSYSESAGSEYLGSNVTFVINGECDGTEIITKFGIVQNGKFIAFNEDNESTYGITDVSGRTFTVPASALEEGGKLEAYMKVYDKVKKEYREVRAALNIEVYYEALPIHVKKINPSSSGNNRPNTYSDDKNGQAADYSNLNDIVQEFSDKPITIKAIYNDELFDKLAFTLKYKDVTAKISYNERKKQVTIELSGKQDKNNKKAYLEVGGKVVIGITDKGYKLIQADVTAKLGFKLKKDHEVRPFAAIPLLAWFAIKCEVSLSLSGSLGLSFNINNATGKLKLDPGVFVAEGSLSLWLAAGIDLWVCDAYAGIKGTVSTKLTFVMPPFKVTEWYLQGTISLYAKATAGIIWKREYEAEHVFVEGKKYLVGGTGAKSIRSIEQLKLNVYEKSLMQYYAMPSSEETEIDSEAQLVKLSDNKMLLIYVADVNRENISGSSSYDSNNFRKLVYSVGTKINGEWSWSEPSIIDDNGFADGNYSLFVEDNTLYVAYNQYHCKLNGNDNLSEAVSHVEIRIAKFNGNEFGAYSSLTDDEYFDSSAKITVINGTPTVIWQKNKDNNIFGLSNNNYVDSENGEYYAFSTEANEIWIGRYDNVTGNWITSCLVDGLPTVNEFDVTNTGELVLTVDPDSNPFTINDGMNINDSVSYTLNVNNYSHYSSIVPDQENVFRGVYNSGSELFYLDGSTIKRYADNSIVLNVENSLTSFKVLTDSNGSIIGVLYIDCVKTGEDSSGDAIFGIFNNDGEFGTPIMLTEPVSNVYFSTFDAEINGDNIFFVLNSFNSESGTTHYVREIETYNKNTIDLTLSDVKTADIINQGTAYSLAIDATNSSATKIYGLKVAVKNSAGIVVSEKNVNTTFLSGESKTVFVDMPAINSVISGNYTVTVTATGETLLEDNSMTLSFEEVDLDVAGTQLSIDGNKQLLIRVTNKGNTAAQNVNVYAYRDVTKEVDGSFGEIENELLYTLNCGVIGVNQTKYFTVILDEEFLSENGTGLVTVSAQNDVEGVKEHDIDNNTVYISVAHVEGSEERIMDGPVQPYLAFDVFQYEIAQGTGNVEIPFVLNNDSDASTPDYYLSKIVVGETEYTPTISGDKLVLSSSFIKALGEGNHSIEVIFANGSESCVRQLHVLNFKGYFQATWIVDGYTTTQQFATGTVPEYSGNLLKTGTNQVIYSFAGWDLDNDNIVDVIAGEELPEIYSDTTYTAIFESSDKLYNITFIVDGNSTVKHYVYGATPTYTGNLSKDKVNGTNYVFAGWDGNGDGTADYQNNSIVAVTKDTTYTAVFEEIYDEYVVRFVNWDNSIISTNTYHYGDQVNVPAAPSRNTDNTYTYTFNGWDKAVEMTVTGDATYKATYSSTYRNYTVKFVNYDGSVLSENEYHYGDSVTVPNNPSRADDNTYTYTFSGWDKAVATVTGNATYKATYSATYRNYRVKFVNYDGSVLSENEYHYGDSVTVPNNPSRADDDTYTYTFSGWDKEITPVKGNVTYTAVYAQTEIVQIVLGDSDGDGEVTDWDAILLERYLANWSVDINIDALDIDGDGEISDWDAILFDRYLAGWYVELGA